VFFSVFCDFYVVLVVGLKELWELKSYIGVFIRAKKDNSVEFTKRKFDEV
jgi:hypothetical protein